MASLLSVDAARAAVLDAVRPLGSEPVALADAAGRVLAEPIRSPIAVPPFDNSAMDGYALRSGPAGRTLQVVAESRAGRPADAAVGDGQAIRISTGAALPDGADAVVMVERTVPRAGDAVLVEAATQPGENVRRAGEDIAADATVLVCGTPLGPAELGVAANAGAATLRCARRPRVTVVATGDELVAPGRPLAPGQIHESNRLVLATLAQRAGALTETHHVADDPAATERVIAAALERCDVLLLSGGVSVGPHDHVKPALAACGVTETFWRVALRPGKPTWFGTRGDTLVFGLPGNPVSSYVTFLLFARPALRALQGADPALPATTARTAVDLPRTAERDELVRVRLADGVATPTGPQGSHVLTSLLGADGLARIPAGDGDLPAGTAVAIELLPSG